MEKNDNLRMLNQSTASISMWANYLTTSIQGYLCTCSFILPSLREPASPLKHSQTCDLLQSQLLHSSRQVLHSMCVCVRVCACSWSERQGTMRMFRLRWVHEPCSAGRGVRQSVSNLMVSTCCRGFVKLSSNLMVIKLVSNSMASTYGRDAAR